MGRMQPEKWSGKLNKEEDVPFHSETTSTKFEQQIALPFLFVVIIISKSITPRGEKDCYNIRTYNTLLT